MLTVRQIDPDDQEGLQREAARRCLSMEELVRRLPHERTSTTTTMSADGHRPSALPD
jgi:hypothetical protein